MRNVRVNLSEGRWFRGYVWSSSGLYTTVVVTDPGTVDETIGRNVICANGRLQDEPEESPETPWVSFTVTIPAAQMAVMHAALEAQGFTEDDWCAYSRPDGATVTWGSCEPPQ